MSVGRASQHLLTPPAPEKLRGRFPVAALRSGAALHRTHVATREPWWFGNSLGGRFDLPEPRGTCYTGESEIVTLLETWTGMSIVPRPELASRAISTLCVERDLSLADMTSNAGIEFGVTAEISTTIEYGPTQKWASALHAAGYDGIRYWARHEVARSAACIALFAAGGGRPSAEYTVQSTHSLADRPELWNDLHRQTGIEVLDIPHSM